MNELDRIKIATHLILNFFFEGNDLKCSFGNCGSSEEIIFYTQSKI
jgi:hypothetical protein